MTDRQRLDRWMKSARFTVIATVYDKRKHTYENMTFPESVDGEGVASAVLSAFFMVERKEDMVIEQVRVVPALV
jgi:hypothetical protein